MHYELVFDASLNPYRNLWFVLPGVLFVFLGAIMVFRPLWLKAVFRQSPWHTRIDRWFSVPFGWLFFFFAVFWTVSVAMGLWRDARYAQLASQPGYCQMLEGRVENFHPMPFEGHDLEHFDLQRVRFSYSDFALGVGFNNTASHGGPIREGLPIRICHRSGEILRLEVAR